MSHSAFEKSIWDAYTVQVNPYGAITSSEEIRGYYPKSISEVFVPYGGPSL